VRDLNNFRGRRISESTTTSSAGKLGAFGAGGG